MSGGLLEIDANSALGGPGSALHLDGGGIRWRGLAFNDLRAFTLGPNGGTLDTNGRSPVYAHVIPQNGPFTKRGAGSLILTQPHTVVTPWSVLEGSLRLRANMSFAPGTNLVGPGTVEIENATLTLDESSNIDIRFLNVAATLTGSEDVTVNGKLDFANEGKIRTTSPGSTLTIQGGMRLAAFSAVFDGRVIELASDTDHISGSVQLQNGAVINHHADSTWTAKGNNIISGGTFNNAGTFARTTGTGTFTISSLFTNTGLVDIQSGTLSLTSGGTFTAGTFQIAAQAGLSLSGTNLFGAGAAILGQPGSQLTIAGGTTFETARVFGSDFRINGTTLTLNGDTIFNGGVLLNNSSSTITGSGDVAINGLLDFTNEGKIRTTAPGSTLTIQGGMRFDTFGATFEGRIIELASDTEHIRGTVHILNGAVLNHHPGSTWLTTGNHNISGGTFNNAGTFTRNGGTGISTISSAFTNTGTVNANTGILTFSSTFTQTAGSLHLDGGTIRKTGTPINIAGGSVKGSGTIDGNLDINGGRIVLDIAGNSPGVSHDQFVVTGTTDFGPGVVEVAFSNGFAPQMGQEFVLLISAGLSGTPQIQITGLAPGWQFTTQYDPATDEFTLTSLSDGFPTSGSPPPLALTAPIFSPPPADTTGKSITTTATGTPGAVVRLEASDNLSQWTTLSTETLDGSGDGVFSNIHDPLAGDRRFYRLATP